MTNPQTEEIPARYAQPNPNRILIVGGGIVGTSLANHLSSDEPNPIFEIVLIDRSIHHLTGSTGHAPGIVGQLNQNPHLTRLAKESVEAYHGIPGGFDRVGGLEIATTSAAVERLPERLKLATESGLRAKLITTDRDGGIVDLAPDFVRRDVALAALHFLDDGVANAERITSTYRSRAEANGAVVLEATARRILFDDTNSVIRGLETNRGLILTPRIIFATGIWTPSLLLPYVSLPIIPVAHPYLYGGRAW